MGARRYQARWVVPIVGPPIEHGAVLVSPEGRIAAVGPAAVVPPPPESDTCDLGEAALLPGLINLHTHLELTGLDGCDEEQDFPAWIRRLVALKAGRSQAQYLAAARRGLHECWTSGVTTVADTGDSGAVIQALAEAGGSGIAYHEVFGPEPELAEVRFKQFLQRLDRLRAFERPRVRLGASPHAPYTVSGPLYRRVAAHARESGLPVAVHLAESAAESELLEHQTGGFARAWMERGIPLPEPPGASPVGWLDRHGVLGPGTLCIHVVRAGPADLDTIAARGAAIAHCPRSNRCHGHGGAPLRGMLDRGIRVGVGTDSVASVSPPDLLAELREARQLGGLGADQALRLVTIDSARALSLEHEIGSLEVGKWADLAAFRLPGAVDGARLADTLLWRSPGDVVLTVLGGRVVGVSGVSHPRLDTRYPP